MVEHLTLPAGSLALGIYTALSSLQHDFQSQYRLKVMYVAVPRQLRQRWIEFSSPSVSNRRFLGLAVFSTNESTTNGHWPASQYVMPSILPISQSLCQVVEAYWLDGFKLYHCPRDHPHCPPLVSSPILTRRAFIVDKYAPILLEVSTFQPALPLPYPLWLAPLTITYAPPCHRFYRHYRPLSGSCRNI